MLQSKRQVMWENPLEPVFLYFLCKYLGLEGGKSISTSK